jgi:hypothetical protein
MTNLTDPQLRFLRCLMTRPFEASLLPIMLRRCGADEADERALHWLGLTEVVRLPGARFDSVCLTDDGRRAARRSGQPSLSRSTAMPEVVQTPTAAPVEEHPVATGNGELVREKKLPKKVPSAGKNAGYFQKRDGTPTSIMIKTLKALSRYKKPVTLSKLAAAVGTKWPKTVRWALGSDDKSQREPLSIIGRGWAKGFSVDPVGDGKSKDQLYEITKSGLAALTRAERA